MRKDMRRELPPDPIGSDLRAKARVYFFLKRSENWTKLLTLAEKYPGPVYDFFTDLLTLHPEIEGMCFKAMQAEVDRDPSLGIFGVDDQNRVIRF